LGKGPIAAVGAFIWSRRSVRTRIFPTGRDELSERPNWDISVLRSAHDSQLVGYGLVIGDEEQAMTTPCQIISSHAFSTICERRCRQFSKLPQRAPPSMKLTRIWLASLQTPAAGTGTILDPSRGGGPRGGPSGETNGERQNQSPHLRLRRGGGGTPRR
jgi:hypothetical protein